jgi:ABC-type transport system involved in multi-copper enzyme maturation permease subunit
MVFEVFRFELRYQLRQPLFWLTFAFFFLLSFLAASTDAVVLGGSIGKVHRNSPFVIQQLHLVMALLGLFFTVAFVAGTVLRDAEQRTAEMFFATPLKKRDYLAGRFAGAIAACIGLYLAVSGGIALGGLMPWIDPERLGPTVPGPYLYALAVLVAPTLLLTGSIAFALAAWSRSLVVTYAGLLALLTGYFVAGALTGDLTNEALAVLLDPFGLAAFEIATKYWTVADRNTRLLDLAGPFLHNRLLWVAVALGIFALGYQRFSFTVRGEAPRRRRRRAVDPAAAAAPAPSFVALPMRAGEGRAGFWEQLAHQTRHEVAAVFKSVAFLVILVFGVLNMVGNSFDIGERFGTAVYPVTHLMIESLQGSFLFLIVVVVFYSGEVVHRERAAGLAEVVDACPVPHGVLWGGKLAALVLVVLSLLATAMVTGMGIQLARGYTHLEPGLYLTGLFGMIGVPFLIATVLALFLQVVTHHKYLGFLLMILYLILNPALGALDFDHHLYRFGGAPEAPYSDLNGYGRFAAAARWLHLYWGLAAVVLLALTHLFWVRGAPERFRGRLRIARSRLTGPVAGVLAAPLVLLVAVGSFIFYNTNVLNPYLPDDRREERQARYEKLYKRYEGLPQPRITAVYAEVDIDPDSPGVTIRGRYGLRNKTAQAIDELHLSLEPRVALERWALPGAALKAEDAELGYRVLALAPPWAPGEERTLEFDLSLVERGFVNNDPNTKLVENGTFFDSFDYFPHLGYRRAGELQDPNERRKRGLPPIQRAHDLDDPAARGDNALSTEADWVDFETVVSTREDQVALAPGYLIREWRDQGRRYFHYRMDAPILAYWAYLSADWEVARDRWNEVAIEVYHHPRHAYNVARMIDAVKKSLDYFTRAFGPYQHRQVRIVEFPGYETFAQSFPNTIPFSESIGFIARLDDPDAIDYVFYVTAHEVAHQWWGHQVVSADLQGATFIIESLSQYSALLVMEHEYGREHMRRFLKYELDAYLRGRGGELIEELPLLRVEDQPYVHYRKGSVVLYALKEAIGEEAVNQALARYVRDRRFQEPPYTTSRELLSYLAEAVPADQQGLLTDLFERIVLYDNRAVEAVSRRLPGSRYAVRLVVEAQKRVADGQGAETPVALDDWVEVAVFGKRGEGDPAEGKVLVKERRRLTAEREELELLVDQEPLRAGIDPFHLLIDRNPDDNLTRVTAAAPR